MMGSYKSTARNHPFSGVELSGSQSTQSLGVHSTASTVGFSKDKGRTKLEICLVVSCVLLLATCVALAVLFALEITKQDGATGGGSHNGYTTPSTQGLVCNTADCLKIAAEFTRNLNESVDPCDDFFQYACGGWLENNPIPSSENEYVTFTKLSQKNNEKLRNLLADSEDLQPGDPVERARDFYKSCMNENEIEKTANAQIHELIASFGSWAVDRTWGNNKRWNWLEALEKIQAVFADKSPIFTVEVEVNAKDSTKYHIKLEPATFSLLKGQYARDDNKTIPAYIDYMANIGVLLGGDNATTHQDMRDVIELEKQLAKVTPNVSFLQERVHHTMSLKDLENITANTFPWTQHLNKLFSRYGVSITDSEEINVPTPEYLYNMTEIINNTSNRTLSNYFIWTLIRNLVPFLSTPFRQAEQDYLIKASGTKTSPPRWEQCIRAVNQPGGLVFAAGNLWIRKLFDKSIVPKMREMMDNMRLAFRDEVKGLPWLDDETRQQVYEKERYMVEKIGYPEMCANDTLLNQYYKGLVVDDKRYLLNQVNITEWYTRWSLSRLRKAVYKDKWYTGPQAVNAFYQRSRNEINVHAGILQPPFYHGSGAPRAVNFGGIGMVLAHELTHGFDNVGRMFNKHGELVDQWWSNYAIAGFKNHSQCMIDQYSKYPLDIGNGKVVHINGRQTLAENIADNGGMKVAFRAYENWIKKNGQEPGIPGLKKTNRQMFFVSYAQMWCSHFTPAKTLIRVLTNTHTLPIYRVIGVLSNSEEFAEAFSCPAGSRMNPEHKCRVW